MLRFLRLFLALLLSQIVMLFLFLLGVGVLITAHQAGPIIESGSVVWVRLAGEIIEYPTLPTLPVLRKRPISQTAILEALDEAAEDRRVAAVIVDVDAPEIGWGKAAELRAALRRFRESGKPAYAYAPVLDEMGLYVATACDSVFVPPTGKLYLNGIGFGSMYYKGTLDKLEIRPYVSRIGAYKDAVEPQLREDMSPESREQTSWLLDGIWGEFLETVSASRALGRADLEEALARGALQPDEAAERGFIDGVRYREDVVTDFVDDLNDSRLVTVMDYWRSQVQFGDRDGQAIAVVHTRGLILRGRNSYHPSFGTILGAASVVRDLEAAAADDDVAAIVLRIDSPGGEIIASDIISAAVERAQQTKPVVVSMVDVAASGGYMMSFRANSIVALPTTITGSIGSFTGKLNLRGLYNKLGLTKDFVTRGSYPYLYSDYHDWSAEEESLVTRQQQEDYERWVAGIAANRALTPEEVDSLARGRVWTGQQAVGHGLVDELGDQKRAIEVARELASIPEDASVRIAHYPEARGFLDVLLEESDLLWSGLMESWARPVHIPQATSWSILDLSFLP
ncbi:MAG: signal peptide peptidase SppA [Candidatus Krumholzibacteriia bacterium]